MGDYLDVRQDMWRDQFAKALSYGPYLQAAEEVHAEKWRGMATAIAVPEDCAAVVRGFTRPLNVLVYSGVWCGDCVRQGPMLELIGALNECIDVRFAERSDDSPLGAELRINGAKKVPVAVFLSEDFYELGRFGDRLLNVYRGMAKHLLGASCSTGLVVPPADELTAELREWCDIFERMHIIVRLSPMLRERYGD
jgi:hypothetical protein